MALLVLGPKRLPEVGRAIGRGIHDMRSMIDDVKPSREELLGTVEADTPAAAGGRAGGRRPGGHGGRPQGLTDRPHPRDMTVQWGILSTARINDKFIAGVAESQQSAVLAVASRDHVRAEHYASERGIERAYDSYEALLADSDVEAVYISLPNALHLEWTGRALEAGKHVLCEKPLSRRAADVRAAFDLAERHDRLLMEAFMYRHHPQTARLVDLVRSGAIGRLRAHPRRLQLPLRGSRGRAAERRAGGWRADGRRLLLRERRRGCWPASRSW